MTEKQLTPQRLGAYRLLNRLGEGGMGVVFRACDDQDRTVALKVLRSTIAGDPIARRRLAREVETMQRVRSPYVAEVIDADLTGDTPYIVTRYVPGLTLDEVVTANGPLRGTVLARVAFGLAEAIAAVHAAGVVHRDLKPGNVMLLDDAPVVIDFGIAQGPDATRLTLTGMFMGTPGYLAPEVIEGQPSSEASDVHAWGATVAFAATGRPPYGSGQYETIFYRIVNGQPDVAGVPAPLLPLLTAALARDPAQRPNAVTLGMYAAALDATSLAAGPAVASPPPSQAGAAGASATLSDGAGSPALAAAGSALPGADVPTGVPGGPGLAVVPGTGSVPGAEAGTVGPRAPAGGVPASDAVTARAVGLPGLAVPTSAAPGENYVPGLDSPPVPLAGGLAPPGRAASGGAALSPGTRPLAAGHGVNDIAELLPPVRYANDDTRASGYGPGPVTASGTPSDPGLGGSGPLAAGRWDVVLGVAIMVLVASISVLLPVAGTLAALALITFLRASGVAGRRAARRRATRGARGGQAVRAVVTFPWYLVRALGALVMLCPFALAAAAVAAGLTVALVPGDWPLRAIAYAAGAAVAFYGLGPGSSPSRWQLSRMYDAMSVSRTAQGLALAGVGVMSIAAFTAAITWPSDFWPVHTGGWFLYVGGFPLGPLRSLGHLQHLNVAHRISVISGLLRHRLGL